MGRFTDSQQRSRTVSECPLGLQSVPKSQPSLHKTNANLGKCVKAEYSPKESQSYCGLITAKGFEFHTNSLILEWTPKN